MTAPVFVGRGFTPAESAVPYGKLSSFINSSLLTPNSSLKSGIAFFLNMVYTYCVWTFCGVNRFINRHPQRLKDTGVTTHVQGM